MSNFFARTTLTQKSSGCFASYPTSAVLYRLMFDKKVTCGESRGAQNASKLGTQTPTVIGPSCKFGCRVRPVARLLTSKLRSLSRLCAAADRRLCLQEEASTTTCEGHVRLPFTWNLGITSWQVPSWFWDIQDPLLTPAASKRAFQC